LAHRLTLSRAAQLVGVPRSSLQRMVREGELACAEGLVTTDELLRVFPDASLADGGDLERVTRIREDSFGKRIRERLLPSQEVLAQRLFIQARELADTRRLLQRYHVLVESLGERLRERGRDDPHAAAIADWADAELARALALEDADRLEVLDTVLGIMSPRVTVRPSGREFIAEGHDTILAAGLKAGLAFAYGCGNGTCGLCKARVVAGEVRQVRPHDYPLSDAERAQGHVLMCCTAPVADIQVEAIEASNPADIPAQHLVATVRAVSSLAPDTRLLHLQTPRTTRLRFLAGQWARLGVTDAGGDAAISLPIASCPCDDRNIHFHIGRDDADPFAARLFAGAIRPGDAVSLSGPAGRFVLDATAARPRVFAACDLGFAPVKSLVEHALASEAATSIDVLWLSTRPDGRYLENQCRAWADSLDAFRYAGLSGEDPWLDASRLVEAWTGRAEAAASDVFIAGPEAFVEAARVAFAAAGVASGCLHAEAL
jgi:CDP-4-dehydro-6-deoxyglucose reductase